MESIGELSIYQPGLELTEGTVVPAGYMQEFTHPISVHEGSEWKIILRPTANSNGINVDIKDISDPRFIPLYQEKGSEKFVVGAIPGTNVVTFGVDHVKTARVRFLGHRDRRELSLLIHQQSENYDPNNTSALKRSFYGATRRIVMAGPVVKSDLVGFGGEDQGITYPGKAMFYIESTRIDSGTPFPPSARLGIANIADSDGLLRVHGLLRAFSLTVTHKDQMLATLAEISVFARYLPEYIADGMLPEVLPLNLAKWLSLTLAETQGYELQISEIPAAWRHTWKNIKSVLPEDEVKDESNRLKEQLLLPTN